MCLFSSANSVSVFWMAQYFHIKKNVTPHFDRLKTWSNNLILVICCCEWSFLHGTFASKMTPNAERLFDEAIGCWQKLVYLFTYQNQVFQAEWTEYILCFTKFVQSIYTPICYEATFFLHRSSLYLPDHHIT